MDKQRKQTWPTYPTSIMSSRFVPEKMETFQRKAQQKVLLRGDNAKFLLNYINCDSSLEEFASTSIISD